MLRFLYCFLILTALGGPAASQTFYGSTDVNVFRSGRDKEFRNRDESPLTETDLAAFSGLKYYPLNRKYRVKAVLERTSEAKYFQMPTSSGVSKTFRKYGVLRFKLNGNWQSLNVYQMDPAVMAKFPEFADLLFVPFKDLTSGKETYGVGRYIDIKTPKGSRVVLDFNLAYNPNCAYGNDKYSCPIPPKENFIRTEIKAGERTFVQTAK
jgi:uncharacterized protein (DUF1684 family)